MQFITFTFTFSRRFYPKRLTLHSSYSFYILSALAFPGNRPHDLGIASAMLYQLSYRKAVLKLYYLLKKSIKSISVCVCVCVCVCLCVCVKFECNPQIHL